MSSFFAFFAQATPAAPAHAAASIPAAEPALPKPNGRNLTVADVLEHGPIVVTIARMDNKGASAIVTNAGNPDLLGAAFRFEAKTPCVKRASLHVLANMRQHARVTLVCAPGRSNAPILTISDVS
jgi:hypothetical protein